MSDKNNISQTTEPQISNGWVPILVGVLLCLVVVLIWWTNDKLVQNEQKMAVKAEARLLAGYIKADMRSRIPSLQRIVNRWEMSGGTSKSEFYNDTLNYISDLPGLQAIEWVDKNFQVKWVVPVSGSDEKIHDLHRVFEKKNRIALEKIRDTKKPAMIGPMDFDYDGKGFMVYFPIYIKGEFDGFLSAVFKAEEWLNYVFSIKGTFEERENFKVSVFVDGLFVFEQTGWDSVSLISFEAVENIELMGHRFTVYSRPTAVFFENNSTLVNELIAGVGLLLAFLVSFVVHLFQKATMETWRTHLAKKTLEITVQELKKTKDELNDTSYRLDFATKAGKVGIWALDVTYDELSWNSIMYELYDVPPDIHLTYEIWQNALHPEDAQNAEALLENAIQGKGVFDTEFRIILSDGGVRNIKAIARIERDCSGKPIRVTGINFDITKQKKAEDKIQYIADHDALTGLPTLRMAKDRMSMTINTARRNKTLAAVMFIDLDGFKSVNDNYGHEAGDALLKDVSKRFLSSVRETDTVARIGGDEFLIASSEIKSSKDAARIAEKLAKIVSQVFTFRDHKITVGASIGIALYPNNGEDIDVLIKQADRAMYEIKNSGKNGYVFASPE